MRHLIALLCLCVLACGSSQPDSPMSPRPNAQQAEPTGAAPESSPGAEQAPNTPPAEPAMQAPPSTPKSPALDASAPQMRPPQMQPNPSQPAAATPDTSCKQDADCEAVDDMCGMCRCLALAKGSPRPACQEAKVQCIMAPCRGKRPVCKAGNCALIDASSGAM